MHLADFVICDDIRHEVNRKVTLVGVYDDTINLLSPPGAKITWPLAMKLGMYIRLQFDSTDEVVPTIFELSCLHEGKEFMKFDGSLLLKDSVKSLFAIPLVALVPFPSPGVITFSLKLKTAEGKVCGENLMSTKKLSIKAS